MIVMFPHFLKAGACVEDRGEFVALIETAPVPITVKGVTEIFRETKLTASGIDSILRENRVTQQERGVLQAARQSLLALKK